VLPTIPPYEWSERRHKYRICSLAFAFARSRQDLKLTGCALLLDQEEMSETFIPDMVSCTVPQGSGSGGDSQAPGGGQPGDGTGDGPGKETGKKGLNGKVQKTKKAGKKGGKGASQALQNDDDDNEIQIALETPPPPRPLTDVQLQHIEEERFKSHALNDFLIHRPNMGTFRDPKHNQVIRDIRVPLNGPHGLATGREHEPGFTNDDPNLYGDRGVQNDDDGCEDDDENDEDDDDDDDDDDNNNDRYSKSN
jgi:hypothetical protein